MRVISYYEYFTLQSFFHCICVTLLIFAGFRLKVQDDEEWPRRNFGQSFAYFNVVYIFICYFYYNMCITLKQLLYIKKFGGSPREAELCVNFLKK